MLNVVRKKKSLWYGTMKAREGWWCGARMNWKGILGNGIVVHGVGGMKRQRRSRRSTEPVDNVEVRLPCYPRCTSVSKLACDVFHVRALITLAPIPAVTVVTVMLTLNAYVHPSPVPKILATKSSS